VSSASNQTPEDRQRIYAAYDASQRVALVWRARSMDASAARPEELPSPDDDPQDYADGQFEVLVTEILTRFLAGEDLPTLEGL